MVTRSASFSAKTNQTAPVKAKESSGTVSKKAGRKQDKFIATKPPATSLMEVANDDVPAHLHSSPNSNPASSTQGDTQLMQQLAPSTPKQSRATLMASQATPTRNNRSPASRPFRFYFNMRVSPKCPAIANLSAQQRVDAYRDNLVDLLESLYKIDNTIALWPFKEPLASESELLTNPTSLGSSITQLTKYFQGLRIRNEFSPFSVSILLGFSMAFEDFMEYVRLMFADHKAYLYKRPLQEENVTTVGWLLGSHEDLCLPSLEKLLQETILRVSSSPSPTPKLALSYKSIWDGSKKSDRDKENETKSFRGNRKGLYAIHVDVETSMALSMKSLIKKALKSPMLKAYTNLPFLLVLILTYKTPQSDRDDIDHARAQHQAAQKAMVKHFSSKIRTLDHPLVSLGNAMLRTTLMAVKAPDGKNLLLSVDHSWNGEGFSFVFPARYRIKVQEFVEYLPKYLQHEHRDAVFRWFTVDAIEEAKDMGWDEKLQQPILQDGIDLKANLQLLDFEWCLPVEQPHKIDLTGNSPVDMDNLSLPSFRTLGNNAPLSHPAGPSTKISDTPKATAHCASPSSATVASDDLMADSTIASQLSALETNWNLILQRLDKLADMGKPPQPSGKGSTSTLPDHLIPGTAETDPGSRV